MKIYFDGSCFPNPNGKMGAAAIFVNDDNTEIDRIVQFYESNNNTSNNVAEHIGCSFAFDLIIKHDLHNITILGDSKMVVTQLNGLRAIKSGAYVPYGNKNLETYSALKERNIKIIWIPREQNTLADKACEIIEETKENTSNPELIVEKLISLGYKAVINEIGIIVNDRYVISTEKRHKWNTVDRIKRNKDWYAYSTIEHFLNYVPNLTN